MNALSAPSAAATAGNPPAASRDDDDDEINLVEYLDILIDHKWWITGITALALILGAAYAILATPIYESNLLVQVEDSATDPKGFLGDVSSLFDVKAVSAGEIQVLQSRMVLAPAVEQTRLYIDARPKYLPLIGRWLAKRADGLSSPGPFGYVSGTESIEITRMEVPEDLEDDKPFTVTAEGNGRYTLTQHLLDDPLHGTVGQPLEQDVKGLGHISMLITQLDGQPGAQFVVERASRQKTISNLQNNLQLTELGKQSNVINVTLQDDDRPQLVGILNAIGDEYINQNVARKAAEAEKTLGFLDKQLPEFRRQLDDSDAAFAAFRKKNGTVAFDEEAKGVLAQLVDMQTKLLEAQQQRREVVTRFTDKNVRVQTIDKQIAAIQDQINGLNARVSHMPLIQQEALELERDVRVNSELYQSMQNNALQMRLLKEGKTGNVRLLDKASFPREPVKPKKLLVMAAALLLGLFVGAALAIVRALFLRGVSNPQEIEAHTGLSVYATVPYTADQGALDLRASAGAKGIQLLAEHQPDSQPIEALRSLRVALQFASLEAENNRILITGATPGIGKSFISGNFAAIMAHAGKRVLLIDADLRKGHLQRAFGLPREGGLSELLAGDLPMDRAVHANVVPNLDVLTTGKLPVNPADMLMSDTFVRVLDALSAQYDIVIVDTPPVLVVADTAAVAPHCGVVLLVARADQTHLGEINESTRRLVHGGKHPNGVVFNGMDLTRRHYGSYGYKYGGYRYAEYKYKA
ncbi:MAG: polysaccharide biosynthesis tyrosine autokinase [Xenophilus sp.]